ncbi:hypothetical protein LEN26_019919 [Aphanomyces euteiches]|nr:hypothetical protein LEN26_019919 [Aphanomyces euteiches]KAH9126059.1 hypothetical protein AeMF1_003453 [Aphanomyces euteiches]KAH9190744.1 hypothetical protein AeNC1_007281 [Aphanomyces euteiches]
MTEPWPWTVTHRVNPPWPSFDAFTNATLAKLQRIYNNQTLDPQTICKYDSATNSHVMRYTLDVPHAVPEDAWLVQLTNFPAAFLYGAGLRRFVYTFLQANQTERRIIPWHECEHVWMVGVALSEVCVWIEQPSPDHTLYQVYHASEILETILWSWTKCSFRFLLTTYIQYRLWSTYYRHYIGLLDNLRQFGVNDKTLSVHHYEVVVGDPTYMILSDPFVSLVMVVDVWLGVAYAATATIRAGQVSDLWLLLLGMLYSSRYVWFAYFVMRILSFVAKRQHCEDRFSPLDPTLLALFAYLYGGPVMSVFDNTRLMAIFHPLWSLFVPASMKY